MPGFRRNTRTLFIKMSYLIRKVLNFSGFTILYNSLQRCVGVICGLARLHVKLHGMFGIRILF